MISSAMERRLRIVIAVAVLCAASVGCAVGPGNDKFERTGGNGQMRYYGGPKAPMWSSQ